VRGGLAAEFADAGDLLAAATELRRLGYREIDAFTPHPIEGMDEALHLRRSSLNWVIFLIGIGAALGGFLLMAWCNAIDYPINVGGRANFAVPAFIPITFESGVLAAGVSAFVILFWVLGLPRLAHPIFRVPGFERASIDRYFLAVDARDVNLDPVTTVEDLQRVGALRVAPFGAMAG
jgi:hypothetical protein